MQERVGKSESFEQLYEQVFPILMRVTYHITGSTEVAEELCQEAFIRYYKRETPLPSPEQAKYWLIRVVKNLAYNHEKRRGREIRAYDKFLKQPSKNPDSGEDVLLKKELKQTVEQELQKLPYKLRMPLVLREYGGLNYKEIAKVLKITEGNVKVRIFRARERLYELLNKGGDVYVP